MDLLATLLRSGGIEGLARQTGLKSKAAASAAEALLPVLVNAMRRYVRAHGGGRAGLARLMDLLGEHGDGALAAQILGHEPVSIVLGDDLIDRLFPDDDIDAVVADASAGGAVPGRVLPMLAMLLGGYVSARFIASGSPDDLGEFTGLFTNDNDVTGSLAG